MLHHAAVAAHRALATQTVAVVRAQVGRVRVRRRARKDASAGATAAVTATDATTRRMGALPRRERASVSKPPTTTATARRTSSASVATAVHRVHSVQSQTVLSARQTRSVAQACVHQVQLDINHMEVKTFLVFETRFLELENLNKILKHWKKIRIILNN